MTVSKAAVALVLAVLAGCGGGGDKEKPLSAADRRAELDRWVTKADAICDKTNQAIADRGWPRDLVQLERLSGDAVGDVRNASRAVQALAPAKGSEARIKPLLSSLKALDGLLGQVDETTERYRPAKLNELAGDVGAGLLDVELASRDLGLRKCAADDEHTWVPEAMRAPVFAQQLADLSRRMTKRAKAVARPVSTPGDAGRNLHRLSDVTTMADRALAKLKPPRWAELQTLRYVDALRDLTGVLEEGARTFDATLTYSQYQAYKPKLDRALAKERKRFEQLYKAIGALPTARGGKGGKTPAGDGEQSA